ncbi:MAG: hypothetical protein AAGE65_03000 [Planctomycetota bacterium]
MATIKEKMGSLLGKMRGNGPARKYDVARIEGMPDPEQKKQVTLAEIKQGYGEIVDTMQALRSHLEDTQQRQAQMAQMMEGLPAVLSSLPEATRTQTQLIRAIGSHLESQNTTNGHLTEAIQGLSKSADRQDDTLGQIREHLVGESDTRRELHTGVLALNSTLESVEASNLAAKDALTSAQDQARQSEERMAELYRKGQRTNMVMLLLSAVMVAAAVGVVAWLVVNGGAGTSAG